MAKSRKKKKYVQKDSAGNPANSRTKKHVESAKRAMLMRTFVLKQASDSLTSIELNELLRLSIERKKSKEKVKPSKVIMTYIQTALDENHVPMDGETKQLELSANDIPKLRQIAQMKEQAEQSLKEEVIKNE